MSERVCVSVCVREKRERGIQFHTHTQMNVGGASDRPVPSDIWRIVQLKMSGSASEDEVQQAYSRVRHRGSFSICTIL